MDGIIGGLSVHGPSASQLTAWLHRRAMMAAFAGLVLIGGLGRILAAQHGNLALVHPDEHQQYLEQAIVSAYGYGVTFWEQDRHMRHPLYPTLLGGLVQLIELAGWASPYQQAFLIRTVLALTIWLLITAYGYRWWQEGDAPAALMLLLTMTLAIDAYYIQTRALSENAMAIPLLLALLLERRWPALAGGCLAILFAVRFQSALLIAPWVAASAWMAWQQAGRGDAGAWRPFWRLLTGLSVGLILLGAWERLAYGAWFHTPLEYFQASALEGGASQFGVKPIYYYIVRETSDLLRASLAIPFLLWAARASGLRWVWLMAACLAAHSLIGHKEARFLWMLLPLLAITLAQGFSALWQARRIRWGWAALIALTFLVPSLIRLPLLRWRTEPYASSCQALEWVAVQPDVTGVGLLGVPDYLSGNHFYLRRDLPLIQGPQRYPTGVDRQHYTRGPLGLPEERPGYVLEQIKQAGKAVNYLVVTASERHRLKGWPVDEVMRFGDLGVLRVR